jgi:hypothetical protein
VEYFGLSPFAWVLVGIPLASYLFLLALVRMQGSCLVTSGGRDVVALAIGISGLVAIGPLQLFFPPVIAAGMSLRVTAALLLFYALCVILLILLSRPRLVIYNADLDQVRSAVHRAADSVLPGSERSPDGVYFPPADLRLRIEGSTRSRAWQIVAWGPTLRPTIWRAFRMAVARELAASRSASSAPHHAWSLLLWAVVLGVIVVWQLWQRPIEVATGFREFLRI